VSRVAVVVPTWNGGHLLPACLDSLRGQTQPHTVVVVDNGSHDGTVELVGSRYPDVVLVELPHNHGFAGGVNRGIEAALARGAELVALLNNDAVASPSWLAELVGVADAHPEAGSVQARMLSEDGTTLDSTGDAYSSWGLPYPRGRGEPDDGRYGAGEVFTVSGGASLYRGAALRQVGLFDERFFAYYEDVDLGFRLRLAGWTARYAPSAVVHHRISGTSARVPDFARFHVLRNLPWVYAKCMPPPLARRYLPRLLALYAATLLSGLLRGHARVTARALAAAVRQLPAVLRDRRRVQALRVADAASIDALLDHELPPGQDALRRARALVSRRAT
jgi:GT2 family glycosyltransferase